MFQLAQKNNCHINDFPRRRLAGHRATKCLKRLPFTPLRSNNKAETVASALFQLCLIAENSDLASLAR
jgi:hypothetical protein